MMNSPTSTSISDDFYIVQSDDVSGSASPYSGTRKADDEVDTPTLIDDDAIEHIASPASVHSFDDFSPSPPPVTFSAEHTLTSLHCVAATSCNCGRGWKANTPVDLDHLNTINRSCGSQGDAAESLNSNDQYRSISPTSKHSTFVEHHLPDHAQLSQLPQTKQLPRKHRYDYFEQPDHGPPGSGVLVPMTLLDGRTLLAAESVACLKIRRNCSDHAELDSLILDLLVEHALNARASSTGTAEVAGEVQLKHQMLTRLMQLPPDHTVIKKFFEDTGMAAGPMSCQSYLASTETRQVVYRQVFTDLERIALWSISEMHHRHFTNPCQFEVPTSTFDADHYWTVDSQTRQQGQEVARLIHAKCIENMDANALTAFIFGAGSTGINKVSLDALRVSYHSSLMYDDSHKPHSVVYETCYNVRCGNAMQIALGLLLDSRDKPQLAHSHMPDDENQLPLMSTLVREHSQSDDDKIDANLRSRLESPKLAADGCVRSYNSGLRDHTLQQFLDTTFPAQRNIRQEQLNRTLQVHQARHQQRPHALQDYQLQLMLLEQQNKKRLLMSRQEQENLGRHRDLQIHPQHSQQTRSDNQDYQLQLMLLEEQNRDRVLVAKPEQPSSWQAGTDARKKSQEHDLDPQRSPPLPVEIETADRQYLTRHGSNLSPASITALPIRPASSKPTKQSTAYDHRTRTIGRAERLLDEIVDKSITQAEQQRNKDLPRLRKDGGGRPWLAFEYTNEGVTREYTIRCDIAEPELDSSTESFSDKNDIFLPVPAESQYRLRLRLFDLADQQNVMLDTVRSWGLKLVQLNPLLRGKRHLLIHAISSLSRAQYKDGTEWSPRIPYVKPNPLNSLHVASDPATFSAMLTIRPRGASDQVYHKRSQAEATDTGTTCRTSPRS